MTLDDAMHLVYRCATRESFTCVKSNRACSYCGDLLETYYCECRLYMVRCKKCGIMAFAKAETPDAAIMKTLGKEES